MGVQGLVDLCFCCSLKPYEVAALITLSLIMGERNGQDQGKSGAGKQGKVRVYLNGRDGKFLDEQLRVVKDDKCPEAKRLLDVLERKFYVVSTCC